MDIQDLIRSDRKLITEDHLNNMIDLCARVSILEKACGLMFRVTSGYRSKADHERIYSDINKKRLARAKEPLRIPWGSAHLSGQAVDVLDMDLSIQKWVLGSTALLEENKIWCEDFAYTSKTVAWVHFQSRPPKSGKRFFVP